MAHQLQAIKPAPAQTYASLVAPSEGAARAESRACPACRLDAQVRRRPPSIRPEHAPGHGPCPTMAQRVLSPEVPMRSARHLGPALAVLAATACSSFSSTQPSQPTPAVRRGPSTAATLGIPPGHLPPPGQCRVWLPGNPPGHQPRSRSCADIERTAPAGSWIVYRPSKDRKVVHVRVVDERRPGVVVHLRVYDVERGTLIREG